ncbi:MAG: PTS transporter subunit IIC [Tissierellia bacterium]|nr:PTS transporter subunit IIC [Tissierellia bacterium]
MLTNIVNYILNLGAAIFLPIIMMIFGLIMKMKPRRAIIAGITLGIAFTGMSLVLGFMMDTISPVSTDLAKSTGLDLNTVDVGWTAMSAIAWAWPYAILMFPIQLGINIVMMIFKWTDTLNVDLWNVWGKIFTATMVAAISGNMIFGFVAAIIQIFLELKLADINQKRIQEITNIPGVTCTHYMTLQCSLMYPIEKLLDKIPALRNSKLDSDMLKDKIGIFGENSVMGLIIGSFLALIAGYNVSDTLNVGMKVATALVLFPMVAKLFMQSLSPISDAAGDYMKNKFKDREIYIGMDWPFMAGRSELWVVAIILVPIELGLSFLFAKFGWSTIIPLAGIVNVIVVVPAMIVANGNLIKMLIQSIIFTPAYLIVSSKFAPHVTELARQVGTIDVPAGQNISYFGVEAPIFRWSISGLFAGDFVAIGIFAVFVICVIYYLKGIRKDYIKEEENA